MLSEVLKVVRLQGALFFERQVLIPLERFRCLFNEPRAALPNVIR